jgi:hypothetical protein
MFTNKFSSQMQKVLLSILLGTIFLSGAVKCGANAAEIPAAPAFQFNFKDANGRQEISDLTGKAKCISNSPLVVENGALHVDYGAQITIPAKDVPSAAADFTLSAWVLISTQGAFGIQQYNPIFSKGLHQNGVELDLAIQGQFPVFRYATSNHTYDGITIIGSGYGSTTRYTNPKWVKSDPEVQPNVWTYLTVEREKNTIRIFKNGQLIVERDDAPPAIAPTQEPLYIGAERIPKESDNYNTSNMLINDIRMDPKVLSDNEIKAIYDAEKSDYPTGNIPLSPIRNYYPEEMQEYSYDLDNKLNIVKEYEKHIPSDPYAGMKTMTSAITNSPRQSQLLINNTPSYPLAVFPGIGYVAPQSTMQSSRMVRDFAAAGVNLVTLSLGRVSIFCPEENKYDWTKVDLAFHEMVKANPKAKIMASIYVAPTPWFIQKYPDQLEKYFYNDNDPSAGLKTWPNSAPLSSQKWQDVSCDMISAFVKHVEAQPYANHVYGYHIASGDAGEWYWAASFTGGMPGYSTATRDSFREWLKAEYNNDLQSFRSAWQNQNVTFDTADVPSPQERTAAERWIFRNYTKSRNVLDFRQYLNDTTFKVLSRSMETAKNACGWRKIISTYYGYSLLFAGKGSTLQKGGILNLQKVLSLKSLDMLASPVDYVARRGGEPGMNIDGFAGSARLHDKMIWREEDLRTHFWPRFEFGRTSNTHEDIGVITRDFGHSLTNDGMGLWFTAQAGNSAFHQNAMMNTMQQVSRAANKSLTMDRRGTAQVALIFDEKSLMDLAVQTNGFIDAQCWGTYQNASMMGAPFDVYLLSDLDKIPDHKLYIFMDAYDIDAATRQLIQNKVRRNNAVSVWCYAPGYISENGFGAKAMEQLTGIHLNEILQQETGALQVVDHDNPITKYADTFPSYTVGPVFEVADKNAKTLATLNGKPAVALREFNNGKPATSWRSVYSLMPLTKELLMGLCDYAGVHVYSRSFDVFGANKSYIMLHAVNSGKKVIDLPGKYDVYNALTNQKIASNSSQIIDSVPAKETRIYRLQRP